MGTKKLLPLIPLLILLIGTGLFAQTISVTPEQGLNSAIDFANQGNADVLELTDVVNPYYLTPTEILVPLTIKAAEGLSGMPTIVTKYGSTSDNFIKVKTDLKVQGIIIDGYDNATAQYDSVRYLFKIMSTAGGINETPDLIVEDCHIRNIYRYGDPETSVDGNIFDISTGARTGDVRFERTTLENTGDEAIRAINVHKDPAPLEGKGFDNLIIRDCTFININGSAVKIEGDSDANTPDANVLIENCTFYKCLKRVIWERDERNTIIRNLIISYPKIGNDSFAGTGSLITFQRAGSVVSNIDTFAVLGVQANGDTIVLDYGLFVPEAGSWTGAQDLPTVITQSIYGFDPMFADPENGDFTMGAGSACYVMGHDGGPVGDRRWATNPPVAAEDVVISVSPDQGLNSAIDFANQGNANVLELTDDVNSYYLTPTEILVPLTIRAASGLSGMPTIVTKYGSTSDNFIKVKTDLKVQGIMIDGYDAVTAQYDSVRYLFKVMSTAGGINETPDLIVEDCHIKNIYRYGDPETSVDGNIFDISTGARTGDVRFERTTLENTGDEALRAINVHKDPVPLDGKGFDSFIIRDCTFLNVNGSAIKIEGDSDASTPDAIVIIENCTFYNCLKRVIWERDHENTVMRNLLITYPKIGNDTFSGTGSLITFQRAGSFVAYVDTFFVQQVQANGDTIVLDYGLFVPEAGSWSGAEVAGLVDSASIFSIDPQFADPANGDFTLSEGNALLTMGYDGGPIGDRRWAPGWTPTDVETISEIPTDYALSQNYPNPFNPTTKIQFSVPAAGNYNLRVYNILGQEVASLLNGEVGAGLHVVNFDASRLASGVYIYALTGNNVVLTKKMILLK